jgi:hypothetical protein
MRHKSMNVWRYYEFMISAPLVLVDLVFLWRQVGFDLIDLGLCVVNLRCPLERISVIIRLLFM